MRAGEMRGATTIAAGQIVSILGAMMLDPGTPARQGAISPSLRLVAAPGRLCGSRYRVDIPGVAASLRPAVVHRRNTNRRWRQFS